MTLRKNVPRAAACAILFFLIVRAEARITHTVQPGDTLGSISKHYFGNLSGYQRIATLNGMVEPYRLEIGQELLIPDDDDDSAIPAPAPSVAPPAPIPVSDSSLAVPPPAESAPQIPDAPISVVQEIPVHELEIIDLLGFVKTFRDGVSDTVVGSARIRVGDSVRTDPSSYALLSGTNGEIFRLDASTSITIQELIATDSDRRIVIRIDQGQLGFSSPEIPTSARYVFIFDTGSVSLPFGALQIRVIRPGLAGVSVFEGNAHAQIPLGSIDISSGTGALLRRDESPASVISLPPRPGLAIETSAMNLILAASAWSRQDITFDVSTDSSFRKLFGSKTVPTNAVGVAVTRFSLPSSRFWIRSRAVDESGLASMASFADAIPPAR